MHQIQTAPGTKIIKIQMTNEEGGGSRGGKLNLEQKHKPSILKTDSLTLVYAIIMMILITLPSVSAIEMMHRVQLMDHDDRIVVYVTTSQMPEITLERFEPVKVASEGIRFSKANYNVMGLNCVAGRHATFRLQPISRNKDVVIPITVKYGNQSRAFTYTILAEESVPSPAAPAIVQQPVAPESVPAPLPGKNELLLLLVVLGAT